MVRVGARWGGRSSSRKHLERIRNFNKGLGHKLVSHPVAVPPLQSVFVAAPQNTIQDISLRVTQPCTEFSIFEPYKFIQPIRVISSEEDGAVISSRDTRC